MRPCATRLSGCVPLVTLSLQQGQVVSRLTPSLRFGTDGIDFPRVSRHAVPSPCPARPLGWRQERGDARRDVWRASYASAPVDPVSVGWTARALDCPMSRAGGGRGASAGYPAVGCGARPPLPRVHAPGLARAPGWLRVWVAGDCPALPPRVDRVVKGVQAPGAGPVRVVSAPAHARRVQRLPPRLLRCGLLAVKRRRQCCHRSSARRVAGCAAWCDTRPASSAIVPSLGVPRWGGSEGTAAAVASRGVPCPHEGMGETRRAGGQSASSVWPPRWSALLPGPHARASRVEAPQGIGRDPACGCLQASAPPPWHPRAPARLSTVQGQVGQERGPGASWPGPCCRGAPRAGRLHPRLPPSLHVAAAAWARVERGADGGRITPVEAGGEVGRHTVVGLRADERATGGDRLGPGPARSAAVAGGGTACGPCGCAPPVGQRWEGAVGYGGGEPPASGRWPQGVVSLPAAPAWLCHPSARSAPAAAAAWGLGR